MKKILFILFLFPIISYSQMTIEDVTFGYQTLGIGSAGTGAYAPGQIYIVFCGTTNSGGTPATVSLAGTNQTWTQIDNKLNIAGDYRIQAFRWAPTTTSASGTINVTYTGTQDGGWLIAFRVLGAQVSGTNGSGAIVQSVNDAKDANANPTLTLAAISNPHNSVVTAFINNANPFGGTAEAGWTSYGSGGYSTPTTGGFAMHRTTTTDNTPTVTAAASNWAGIAIEVKGSRRAAVIN